MCKKVILFSVMITTISELCINFSRYLQKLVSHMMVDEK